MLQNVEYSVADITFIKPILYADHSLKTLLQDIISLVKKITSTVAIIDYSARFFLYKNL